MPKHNIHAALFDVRPREPREFERVVNLRRKVEKVEEVVAKEIKKEVEKEKIEEIKLEFASSRDIIADEVEKALGEDRLVADLVRAGATVHESRKQAPARPRIILQRRVSDTLPEPTLPEQQIQTEPDHQELEIFWNQGPPAAVAARASFEPHYKNPFPVHSTPAARDVERWLNRLKKKKFQRPILPRRPVIFAIIGFALLTSFAATAYHSGVFGAKEQIIQNGNNAVANLEVAKQNLEEFKFTEAADHFALANDDFEKASGTLSNFGASFLSLFGNLPGFSKVRSAQNLVDAGQNIAKAGENLSRAFSGLYKTNFFAMISTDGTPSRESLAEPIENFQEVLEFAQKNIKKAGALLRDVDIGSIPQEKQKLFEDFRSKVPSFQAYIGQALDFSNFLLDVVGKRDPKTYLVLLQNTSERRPTGGFPGTYAIITFERGSLRKVFVDDIYNPDGQIKENRIPPIPLQHITPNWGLRDANWFADFPSSARNVAEYYELDGGAKLDGVFAVTPTLIMRMLSVIGPIEMPEYGVTLDADNFLAEIQNEVEVKGERSQPKRIVSDFQPKFFEKLASADKNQWVDIIKVLFGALEEKHIIAYFANEKLQKEVAKQGFAGELKKADEKDYLQVAFSNIKGAKTDAVTSNAMNLSVSDASRTLTITRSHQGGDSKHVFYNRENSAYVKVYLPKGSTLVGIDGNSDPKYKSLVAHLDLGFKPDPDLAEIESTMTHPAPGVDVFEESGKTVIGFWQITKPRKTSTVKLMYHVARNMEQSSPYQLYVQKQSGSENDQIHVNVAGTTAFYDADLSVDREIKIEYK